MAQLKDTIILGKLNVTGVAELAQVYTNILMAPSASNGTTYSAGTNGQVLVSNGSSIYWKTLSYSDVGAAEAGHAHSISLGSGNGSNPFAFSAGQQYALTAGGNSIQFTMPSGDGNTLYSFSNTYSLLENVIPQITLELLANDTSLSPYFYRSNIIFSGDGSGVDVTGSTSTTNNVPTHIINISHADTSSQSSVSATANTFISAVTLDTYGHVTGLSTATASSTDTKNTAGSTASTEQLYIIGATEQSANPQTYSVSNVKVQYNSSSHSLYCYVS